MPRQNAPREIRERGEANLARRIEYERAARGLSYEALAKAMGDAGCPIQGSALYRVEKGDPPRKITVDELVALAEVFGQESVDDLLRPMEHIARRDALELFHRMKGAQTALVGAIDEALAAAVDYLTLARSTDDLREFMTHQIEAAMVGPNAHDESLSRHASTESDSDPIGDAYRELLAAILEFAEQVVSSRG